MSTLETNDAKNPSLIGVAFVAILVALGGAFSGFVLLASVQPEPFESVADYEADLEENSKPNILNAYYFKGSDSAYSTWSAKRAVLLNEINTSVEFTDAEINAWIADKFEKPDLSSLEAKPKAYVVTGLPNVFFDPDGVIHFNILLEVVLWGKEMNYLLIGQGYFPESGSNEFLISKLRLNEAVIPLPEKLLKERILGPLLRSFYQSVEFTELKNAWEKVGAVEMTEAGVRLSLN